MKSHQGYMLGGTLITLLLFVLPIWKITLEAPQYPTPLGMYIHIDHFADDNPHDIKNINLMNHYVGMKEIPERIPEFDYFPWVVGITILLGCIIAFTGKYRAYLGWFILVALLGAAGLYDFYLWESDYGHNLDPKAIMKFTNPDGTPMGFQPPFIGSKDILNFKAHSYPQIGAFSLLLGMILSLVAYSKGKKAVTKKA